MTDDNQTNDEQPAEVIAQAPADGEFPELKNLSYKEMYDLVGKFIQKSIPIKGAKLTIIKGLTNRVSAPKPPYAVLQIIDEKSISSTETRYTDKHKILWSRSMVTMELSLTGNENVPAMQMAKAFSVRFNDAWASEQFEQFNEPFFPLYSDDARIEPVFLDAEEQFQDRCSMNIYFEYHPEVGVCETSAKEIIMDIDIVS